MASTAATLYYERQEGDLCRMHALNHYAQRRAFNPSTFANLINEFASTHPSLPNPHSSDGVDASQQYVVTYGVERLTNGQCTTFSVPVYHHERTMAMLDCGTVEDLVDEQEGALFVYNPGHIWAARRLPSGQWVVLDSQHAPRTHPDVGPIVRRAVARKNHGLLLVWGQSKMKWACSLLRQRIRLIIGDLTPIAYVRERVLYQSSLLSDLEVPLALYCRYHNLLRNDTLGNEFFNGFEEHPANQEHMLFSLTPLLTAVMLH